MSLYTYRLNLIGLYGLSLNIIFQQDVYFRLFAQITYLKQYLLKRTPSVSFVNTKTNTN